MSLYHYFQPTSGGLPDPQGPLSEEISPRAIESAKKEVQNASQPKQRGPYNHFTAEHRATIGKYAGENGVAAASRYFSKKFENNINESTVRGMNAAYLKEVIRKRKAEEELVINALLTDKQGRPLLLGVNMDKKVQLYLKKLREGGGAVSARVVVAAARGIIVTCDKTMLEEYGVQLSWESVGPILF